MSWDAIRHGWDIAPLGAGFAWVPAFDGVDWNKIHQYERTWAR
jgi:hypothetical protein